MRKLIFTNVLLFITVLIMGLFWHFFEPQFISTKIGITLIFGGIAVFMSVYNSSIPLLSIFDEKVGSSIFLAQLIRIKEKQLFLHRSILNLYFVFLTVGICLTLYEYASRMLILPAAISYGFTLVWLAYCWFYARPMIQKKQESKIDLLINNFKELNSQLLET